MGIKRAVEGSWKKAEKKISGKIGNLMPNKVCGG
jgi:hypothetical protein